MSVLFSPAQPADAEDLAAILGGWIQATPWMPRLYEPEEELAFVEGLIAEGQVTIGRTEGRAAGFMARDQAQISCLYLAPFARGRGIGAQLVDLAKSESNLLNLWCFQANSSALRFYAQQGFTEAERTNGTGNDEGLPDVRLVWNKG